MCIPTGRASAKWFASEGEGGTNRKLFQPGKNGTLEESTLLGKH
jgi:hypothetical protein